MCCKKPNCPDELARDLCADHGACLSSVAALAHASESLFSDYGRRHGLNIEGLLAVQRECIDEWLHRRRLTWADLDAARRDLSRASAASSRGGSVGTRSTLSALLGLFLFDFL